MAVRRPFNLKEWITTNRDLLKPPVGNKNLYVESGDYIVMIVGGPNARKDYHFNETEELFYQLEGDIEVGIQEDGQAVTIPIKEGEMFLLPGNVPHQPRRGPNTVGLVIEVKNFIQHNDTQIQRINSIVDKFRSREYFTRLKKRPVYSMTNEKRGFQTCTVK